MNPLIPVKYIVLTAIPVILLTGAVSWITSSQTPKIMRTAMTAARVLAVTGILVLLLNTGALKEQFQETTASWAIMLDQSASMAFTDGGEHSRLETAKDTVAEAFKVSGNTDMIHLYTFSDRAIPMSLNDLASIPPSGEDTRIIESGRQILSSEKSRGSLLRGILLLSDGRQPSGQSPETFALQAAAGGVPIYPVVHGKEVPVKDLDIRIPQLKHVSFVGQPITINGKIINHRLGPIQTDIFLKDAEKKIITQKTILVEDMGETSFEFEIAQDKPGYYEYVIETPLKQGESDRANNTVGIGVFVLAERLKILLLEGEPYWDTKFLSHLLRAQPHFAMTAVFRVTKDRFFKVTSDTAMTASNSDAFPQTIEDLSQYDLIVLGRGSEYFIDTDRATLLEEFVKKQGGCLFFGRGKSYDGPDTHLQNLEPVKWGKPLDVNFSLRPMLSGELVGLFGGLLPDRNDRLWQELPPLTRAYECTQLRSFATVLADGVPERSRKTPFPLIVSKRYGRGLILMINGDGLWKWGFFPKVTDKKDLYQNLWLRLFQWAVSFAEFNPGSDYYIQTDRSTIRTNELLQVRVRARAHVRAEKPVIRIYQDKIPVRTMALADDTTQGSGWNALVSIEKKGIHRLAVESPDGKDLGAQTTIQVIPPPGEADNLSADAEFLDELAQRSGGRIITRKDLPNIIANLESHVERIQKSDISWDSSWDKAWFLLLLVLFFSLEWFWRRRQGLP